MARQKTWAEVASTRAAQITNGSPLPHSNLQKTGSLTDVFDGSVNYLDVDREYLSTERSERVEDVSRPHEESNYPKSPLEDEHPPPESIEGSAARPGSEPPHVDPLIHDAELVFPSAPLPSSEKEWEDNVEGTQGTSADHSNFLTSRLNQILGKSQNEDILHHFESHGISDLWLPIAKQTLRRIFPDNIVTKTFLQNQGHYLDTCIKTCTNSRGASALMSTHSSLDDDEDLVTELGVLGEGGCGIVEKVSVSTSHMPVICVRKRIGRPKQLKAQKQIMAAFAREICVMREVHHRHCVQFLGSYTDADHVNILSLPVADMDLATYLGQPFNDESRRILYRGIGCVCNAL